MSEKDNFAITQEAEQGGIKLTIKGRIDSVNAVELGYKLDEVLQGGKVNVILNMLRVEYLCSTGIRAILKAYKSVKESGGKFGIESASECVKNVLGMAALSEMLV